MKNELFLLENGEILNLAMVVRGFEEKERFFVVCAGEKVDFEISRCDFFKIQDICEIFA